VLASTARQSIWIVSAAALESLPAGRPSSGERTHVEHCAVAWIDLTAVPRAVGQDLVIMWRPKASDLEAFTAVVFPDDVETIRCNLDDGRWQLEGYPYQTVLRGLRNQSSHLEIEMAAQYAYRQIVTC
jgi:hypothetical protein